MKTAIHFFKLAFFICICLNASVVSSSDINEKSGGLAIKIEGTRSQFTPGTSFSVSATITNTTRSTIYLNEQFLVLKVPAEIEGPATYPNSIWWAFMPIADHGANSERDYKATVALRPNNSVVAYWLVDPRYIFSSATTSARRIQPNLWDAIKNINSEFSTELHFLLFSPGKYKLTVSANYWDKPPTSKLSDYKLDTKVKTSVESLIVDVAAPQSVILFGAALGGLIAYILLQQTRPKLTMPTWQVHDYVKWAWILFKMISGAITAMLMSAMVTILLARVAESQFLIRITVSDIWGAMAIGFISNYLGVKILNKIIEGTGTVTVK